MSVDLDVESVDCVDVSEVETVVVEDVVTVDVVDEVTTGSTIVIEPAIGTICFVISLPLVYIVHQLLIKIIQVILMMYVHLYIKHKIVQVSQL